jgi:hypothetical protein
VYSLETIHKQDHTATECYIQARSIDGRLVWKSLYEQRELIPFLEMDIQDIYPIDFFIDGNTIQIKHEHYSEIDGVYTIDKMTGQVLVPERKIEKKVPLSKESKKLEL